MKKLLLHIFFGFLITSNVHAIVVNAEDLLKNDYDLNEIKQLLSNKGETKINLIIKNQNKQAFFSLQENRKFDVKDLKALKAKKYVEKITV